MNTREINRLMKKGHLTAAEYQRVVTTEKSLQEQIVERMRLEGWFVEVVSERSHRTGTRGAGQDKGIADLKVRRRHWPPGLWLSLETKTDMGEISPEQRESIDLGGLWVIRNAEDALFIAADMDRHLTRRLGDSREAIRDPENPQLEVTVREI